MPFKKYILAVFTLTAIFSATAFAVPPVRPNPVRIGDTWWVYELDRDGGTWEPREATPAEAAALNPARPVPAPAAPASGLPITNSTPPSPSTVSVTCTINTTPAGLYPAHSVYMCRYGTTNPQTFYIYQYPGDPFRFGFVDQNMQFRDIDHMRMVNGPNSTTVVINMPLVNGRLNIPPVPRFDLSVIRDQLLNHSVVLPGNRPVPDSILRIYWGPNGAMGRDNGSMRVYIAGRPVTMPLYVEPPLTVRPRGPLALPSGMPTNPQQIFQSESGTLTGIGAFNTGSSNAGSGPSAGGLSGANGLPGAQHDPGNNIGFDIPPLPTISFTGGRPTSAPPSYGIHNNITGTGKSLTWVVPCGDKKFSFTLADVEPAGKPDGIFELYITSMIPNPNGNVPPYVFGPLATSDEVTKCMAAEAAKAAQR